MALTMSPLYYLLARAIAVLWRNRNRYDFHDSPYDVEHRRNDDAYEEQYEGVIKDSLKCRDPNKVLRIGLFFTHCEIYAIFEFTADILAI